MVEMTCAGHNKHRLFLVLGESVDRLKWDDFVFFPMKKSNPVTKLGGGEPGNSQPDKDTRLKRKGAQPKCLSMIAPLVCKKAGYGRTE